MRQIHNLVVRDYTEYDGEFVASRKLQEVVSAITKQFQVQPADDDEADSSVGGRALDDASFERSVGQTKYRGR